MQQVLILIVISGEMIIFEDSNPLEVNLVFLRNLLFIVQRMYSVNHGFVSRGGIVYRLSLK